MNFASRVAATCCAAALAACSPDARDDRPAAPSPAAAAAPARAPAALPASTPPAATPKPAAAPAIELAGVIYLGAGNANSQALISVAHQRQQPFHAGETIAEGWVLQSIGADHVVIARAGESRRIEVDAAARTAAASSTSQRARAAPPEKPLAGFAQSPPPSVLASGSATERNRRFLDAVRQRRAASNP